MIRTVIIDDEPRNIKLIRGIIEDHCHGVEVVGNTDDLAEVIPLIESLKPSLLLLDIGFPSGTIFPILEKLSFKDFQIIFITAHNTYAAEAFKQKAIDYILKPVTKEALIEAIKKARIRVYNDGATGISKLLEVLESHGNRTGKIAVPSSKGVLFLDEAEIIRCEACGRYTVLYLEGNRKMTITRTMKEVEAMLNPQIFFRIHHSHIINLTMTKGYHRRDGGLVELTDGSFVEISSSRKDGFLSVFLKNKH